MNWMLESHSVAKESSMECGDEMIGRSTVRKTSTRVRSEEGMYTDGSTKSPPWPNELCDLKTLECGGAHVNSSRVYLLP